MGFTLSTLRLGLQEYQEEWDQYQTWTMKFEDPAQALNPGDPEGPGGDGDGDGYSSQEGQEQDLQTPEAEMEKDTKVQAFKAMTNDVVLAKIADFLPVRDLMALRATCRLWNSIFVIQLRKKHQRIRLQVSNGVNYPTAKDSGENVRKFLELMKTSVKIPFGKYSLMDFRNRPEYRESFQDFASICGEAVTQLYLHGFWKWEENWETSVIRQALFDQMPNLTDLEVRFFTPWPHQMGEYDEVQGPETVVSTLARAGGNQMLSKLKRLSFGFGNQQTTVELCAQLVSKMIQCAPGLEILELPPYNEDTYDPDYIFLLTVITQLCDFNKSVYKLRHLVVGNVNRSILQLLLKLADPKRGENCLHLEEFRLVIAGKQWKDGVTEDGGSQRHEITRTLGNFLALQSSTLLQLFILLRTSEDAPEANSTNRIPIALPQLGRLHTLTFSDGNDEEFDLHFEGNTFASNFPALNKLQYYINYNFMNPLRESDDNTARIFHPGVTNLSIQTKLQHLAMLPTRFTSVTTLDLRLNLMWMTDTQGDYDALASVWSMWATLTHLSLVLELKADKDLARPDELLTGVPRQQMNTLRHHLAYSESTLDAFRGLVQPYKTRPGVSDLRQLKKFKLHWSSWVGPSGKTKLGACRLTDIGVCCGLALCGPQLQHVDIVGTFRNVVSEPCMKFMKSSSVFGPNAVIKLTPWNVTE